MGQDIVNTPTVPPHVFFLGSDPQKTPQVERHYRQGGPLEFAVNSLGIFFREPTSPANGWCFRKGEVRVR